MLRILDNAAIPIELDMANDISPNRRSKAVYLIYSEGHVVAAARHKNLINADYHKKVFHLDKTKRRCYFELFSTMEAYCIQAGIQDGELFPVIDQSGEYCFIVQYSVDLISVTPEKSTKLGNRLENIDLLENRDLLDYRLLENEDVFVFYSLDNYSLAIAELILEVFPNRQVIFFDKLAKEIFGQDSVEILNGLSDCFNIKNKRMCQIYARRENSDARSIGHEYNSLNVMVSLTWCMKREKLGEKNPDKTVFLIDYDVFGGLGDFVKFTMSYVRLARSRGWLPAIDVKTCPNVLSGHEGENVWNYFFEPLPDISLNEAYESANVIRCSTNRIGYLDADFNPYARHAYPVPPRDPYMLRDICLAENTWKYIREHTPEWLHGGAKVLGAVAKGIGYREEMNKKSGRTNLHVPSLEYLLQRNEELMNLFKCDYIFVASDDEEYFQAFLDHFGEKCRYIDQKRLCYDASMEYEVMRKMYEQLAEEETTLSYFTTLYCLAHCDVLTTSVACGAFELSLAWKEGKYEYQEIIAAE